MLIIIILIITSLFRLQTIHEKGFIHRDFHSGNILIEIIENGSCKMDQYLIGDLGLSQPANNTLSNNEIYGERVSPENHFLKIRSKIFIKSYFV
jgi:serine/threonine protein kinase